MAFAFITESGSAYKVENGRITRYGDNDIVDRTTDTAFKAELVEEPFKFVVPPVLGASCRFVVKNEAHRLAGTPCVTTNVSVIAPIVEVRLVGALA